MIPEALKIKNDVIIDKENQSDIEDEEENKDVVMIEPERLSTP